MFLFKISVDLRRTTKLQRTPPPPGMFLQLFVFTDTPKDVFSSHAFHHHGYIPDSSG